MDPNERLERMGSYWDDAALKFDKQHDTEDLDRWRKVLSELLGDDRSKNVLDLGTGTGFLANMCAELGYPTVGMDISTGMMSYAARHAMQRGVSVMYMTGSALDLPLMDCTVDYIVNARLLWLWTVEESEQALRSWYRALRPGGRFFGFVRMEEGVGMKVTGNMIKGVADVMESFVVAMDELEQLVKKCGYEDVEIRKLEGLTRSDFPDYDPWYVITGKRAETEREKIAFSMAEFWNKSAAEYEPHHALADHDLWKRVLSGFIGDDKDARILDLATGTGMIANMLAEAGYTGVTGMDLSEGMMNIAIGHAAEKGLNVRYVYGNALETGLPDGCVDVVISSRLLWTLAEPENAIREWLRILKPGGKIIAINELDDGVGIRTHSFTDAGGYLEGVGAEAFPFSDIDKEEIVATFTKCGAKDARSEHMKGCHMEHSDKENWFAFIGTKE